MSSHSSIRISIPVPFTKNRDEMTLVHNGRHCAYCSKNVIDFTGYSDAGLYKYINGNKGEVCVRFFTTQVNRPIKIPYQPHSRLYYLTIAMGLTLIFTQSPTSQAQNKLPITSQKSIFNPPQKTEPFPTVSTGILKGWVVDEKKEPLINAAVGVYQDGELKGGNITDYYGNYSISPLKPGDYEVLVNYPAYDSVFQKIEIRPSKSYELNFQLSKKYKDSGCKIYYSLNPTGILKGWVVDEKKEPLINAAVGEYQDGELKGGNITDYYGNYSISPLKPGDYEVLVIALGYDSLKQSDVVIGDTIATSDFILNKPNGINIETMGIIYDKHVLDFDNPGRHIFSATDISRGYHIKKYKKWLNPHPIGYISLSRTMNLF